MSWMLVSDSTCEIHHIDDLAPDTQFATVPLKIRVGDREFVDNAALNVPQMMEVFANFVTSIPKSFDPRYLFMILALVLFLTDVAVRKFKFKWPHEIVRAFRDKRKDKKGGTSS